MEHKIRNIMDKVSVILELILAVVVVAAIVIAIIFLKTPFLEFIEFHRETDAYLEFMVHILNIAIGIEFFRMLCNPGTDMVLDVLMFVIARHMIVHDTSAWENLLTIVGIGIIIVIKRYIIANKK